MARQALPERGRFAVIAGVYLLVATMIAASVTSLAHRRAGSVRPYHTLAASLQPAGPRYAVILVLDGARPDQFDLVPMPHLQALLRRGVTYTQAFVGQELANTPPSHATIGTGVFPKHHGVEGFLWEDPRSHTLLNPTSTAAVLNGALERVIATQHVPTLAGQIKAAYPRARVASVSAHKCYAADAMGTASADDILCALIYHNRWVAQAVGKHRPPPGAINNPRWDVPIPPRTAGLGPAVEQWRAGSENAWTMAYALWAFRRIHPRLLMINLSETDVLGHFAPTNEVIKLLMRRFDTLLGQLVAAYRQAGLLDRTDIIITADHGMTPITTSLPYHLLSQAVSDAGATPVYIEHDTGVAIAIREQTKAHAVALNLFRLGGSLVDATYDKVFARGRWFYRAVAVQPGLGPTLRTAYRTLANTTASAAGPDVLGVLAPHVSAQQVVAYGYPWRAGHLGPQWDDQHIPLILAGPGIKRGVASTYPARLVDIAPTVERLLGAPSGRVDGNPLEDAFVHPSVHALTLQRTRGAWLTRLVHALQRRSGDA